MIVCYSILYYIRSAHIYIYIYIYIYVYVYKSSRPESPCGGTESLAAEGGRGPQKNPPLLSSLSLLLLSSSLSLSLLLLSLLLLALPFVVTWVALLGNGRLKTIMWCDDFWELSNRVIVFWYTLARKQSPDERNDWQQSHHMIVVTFRWVVIKGRCSRRAVQWMGVVWYNKTAYNIMWTTTPCFHCTLLWWILNYLSKATCLIRPHLFIALFVVWRIIIICYMVRHFWKRPVLEK